MLGEVTNGDTPQKCSWDNLAIVNVNHCWGVSPLGRLHEIANSIRWSNWVKWLDGKCLRFKKIIWRHCLQQAELYPEVCYCYVHLALRRQSAGHGWYDAFQFYCRCKFLTDSGRMLFTSYHGCSIYTHMYMYIYI